MCQGPPGRHFLSAGHSSAVTGVSIEFTRFGLSCSDISLVYWFNLSGHNSCLQWPGDREGPPSSVEA